MKNISENDWNLHFTKRGISKDLAATYMDYIRKLYNSSSPVIFEFEHLSRLIGVDEHQLQSMVYSSSSFYRKFNMKKRSGGIREINAPYPSLLMCQDWIYRNILISKPVHDSAHGFVPGRSIFSNASIHLGAKCLLKMDLKDFFPSIKINWVVKYFSDIGYADNISFCLASLCCKDGMLVQGASTSPYLSNILLVGLDKRLSLLSMKYGLKFTRYADDMTFSGAYIPHKFISIVSSVINDYGLMVNIDKTRLQIDSNQKIVTGLSVAGETLTIPRKHKRKIRQEVHFIRRYGLVSHVSKLKERNPFHLESLIGKFNFWLQAEPGSLEAKESIEFLKELKSY